VKKITVSREEWEDIAGKMSGDVTGNACRYGKLTIRFPSLSAYSSIYIMMQLDSNLLQAAFREDSKEVVGATGSPKTPTTPRAAKRKATETPSKSAKKAKNESVTATPKKEEADAGDGVKMEETDDSRV
jgi:hypothetical protein